MLLNVMFEEVLVTSVRNEGKYCVILGNVINCRTISNGVSLETVLS